MLTSESLVRRLGPFKAFPIELYIHFVVFLIGAVFLILANTVLGIGKDFTIAGINWFVYAILIWLFLFVYHFINVFITNKFMGKDWEKQQLDKLVSQQQKRIDKLKEGFLKEEKKIAQSQAYNEAKTELSDEKKNSIELTIIVAAGEDNAIGNYHQDLEDGVEHTSNGNDDCMETIVEIEKILTNIKRDKEGKIIKSDELGTEKK